jgi:uncharacterized membrane protein
MTSSEFRAEARRNLTGKWGKAALISLAYFFITFILGFIQGLFKEGSFLNSLMTLVNFIIEVPLSLGLVIAFVKLYNNAEVKAFDFLTSGFSNFSKSWGIFFRTLLKVLIPIIIMIVSIIILFLGLGGSIYSAAALASGGSSSSAFFYVLLAIGLIGYIASIIWAATKSYYYLLAPIIVAERPELSAKEAVEESEKLMNGNRAKLFWLQLSFIGWSILCAFTFGIGFLWLAPYIQFASIAFYKKLADDSQPIDVPTVDSPIKEY